MNVMYIGSFELFLFMAYKAPGPWQVQVSDQLPKFISFVLHYNYVYDFFPVNLKSFNKLICLMYFCSGITLTKLVGVLVLCFSRTEVFVVSDSTHI